MCHVFAVKFRSIHVSIVNNNCIAWCILLLHNSILEQQLYSLAWCILLLHDSIFKQQLYSLAWCILLLHDSILKQQLYSQAWCILLLHDSILEQQLYSLAWCILLLHYSIFKQQLYSLAWCIFWLHDSILKQILPQQTFFSNSSAESCWWNREGYIQPDQVEYRRIDTIRPGRAEKERSIPTWLSREG